MGSKPVFYDPRGRRGTFVTRVGAVVASIAAVLSTITLLVALFATLYLPAQRDKVEAHPLPGYPAKNLGVAQFLHRDYRARMAQEIEREHRQQSAPIVPADRIVAGFYAPWEATGLASLKAHASALTHVIPQWLHLNPDGASIDDSDFDLDVNTENRSVISISRQNGLRIVPILDNGSNGDFDPVRLRKLLSSPEAEETVAGLIAFWLDQKQFQGINLDFEKMDPGDAPKFLEFLKVMRRHLAQSSHHLTLSVDIEAETTMPLEEVSDLCDWVVLMAYDEHSEDDPPGPIASIDWSEKLLEKVLDSVPNDKLVFGMENGAYDWTDGKLPAASMTFQEALSTAQGYRSEPPQKVIEFDDHSLNSTFAYRDDDDVRHTVWMLDAVGVYDQWHAARQNDEGFIRGAALWCLGSEDPGVWSFLNRTDLMGQMSPKPLDEVKFPYEISFTGRGEILRVIRQPQMGSRSLAVDKDSGEINECTYNQYAFPYVVQKSGYIPKKLALTFDDGPDPTWTPKILDALKALGAPATFFTIGNSCEQHPDIVGREYAEGNEVGSHSFFHPDMGSISDARDRLELNLTQIAIESATGRSTTLFRPPYNADSEPSTADQLKPILIASEMGYVTVAENVDPTDWDLKVLTAPQTYRKLTPDDVVERIELFLRQRLHEHDEGNVILLHDGGGDRSATVAALYKLVPKLRSEGYEFIPVSRMLGTNRDHTMPPIPPENELIYWIGKIVLGTTYLFLAILSIAFTAAIALGLMRITLATGLALAQHRRELHATIPEFTPPVTVLIPAHNEEAVIRRTVESVLALDYPGFEIIVIDDGSSDGTAAAVRASFANQPNVSLISQENGGKSSALNNGIQQSHSELLFCIDADTQLDRGALRAMARHFSDPNVGAVAGNVRVGNEVNIITYWQSLEYTTSQNLDRRAYAFLNAITVVPGAIGAWRKSAVLDAGGFEGDTLAEDMDLTWRLRMAGFRLANEATAFAYTEAPQRFRGFFRQRFRWAYGTLQCLWKHKRALFRYGWFGCLALPALWLFQVVFQAIAPLVDLEVLFSIASYLLALSNRSTENGSLALAASTQSILEVGFLYALFFAVELIAAAIATRLERQRFGLLWWLFLQRFAYRQIMYGVIYRSIVTAVKGSRTGWGKVDRTGTVRMPKSL